MRNQSASYEKVCTTGSNQSASYKKVCTTGGNQSASYKKVCTETGSNQPDLEPQEGEICPVGQVHMLGLEQKPSPQELRQIAANTILQLKVYARDNVWLGGHC